MPRQLPNEKVLLCSSPRSGSTFAANLIRSSPEVEFLNEIMTQESHLLPRFREARRAGAIGDELRLAYEVDVRQLLRYTLPQAGNLLHRNRVIKALVFGLLKVNCAAVTRAGYAGFSRNPFHRFYHLNGLHEPFIRPFFEVQFPRCRSSRVILIKEVHLFSSYGAFRAMYPSGKIIYLIRDPQGQVASERRHLKFEDSVVLRSGTGQSETLDQRRNKEGIRRMVATYGKEDLIRKHYGKSFEDTYSLFWRLDNDALTERMSNESPKGFMALRYEDLVADTRSSVMMLLDFLELGVSRNLERYLKCLSEFRGTQKHGRSTFLGNRREDSGLTTGARDERSARVRSGISGSSAAAFFGYE